MWPRAGVGAARGLPVVALAGPAGRPAGDPCGAPLGGAAALGSKPAAVVCQPRKLAGAPCRRCEGARRPQRQLGAWCAAPAQHVNSKTGDIEPLKSPLDPAAAKPARAGIFGHLKIVIRPLFPRVCVDLGTDGARRSIFGSFPGLFLVPPATKCTGNRGEADYFHSKRWGILVAAAGWGRWQARPDAGWREGARARCPERGPRETAQQSTAEHSTAQHSTSHHSRAQHSTAHHNTAQHRTPVLRDLARSQKNPGSRGLICVKAGLQP
eukprot:gene18001-biopygen20411